MNLKYNEPLSNFAFNFNLRLYSGGDAGGGDTDAVKRVLRMGMEEFHEELNKEKYTQPKKFLRAEMTPLKYSMYFAAREWVSG